MYRLRPPFSAAGRERMRRRVWLALISGMACSGAVVFVSVLHSGWPVRFAVPVAAYVTFTGAVGWAFLTYSMYEKYQSRPFLNFAASGLFASGTGIQAFAIARDWHSSTSQGLRLAVAVMIASGIVVARANIRASQYALGLLTKLPANRKAAVLARQAARRALQSERLTLEDKKTARLNLTFAALAISVSDDAPDGILEATEELQWLLDNPPEDWHVLLAAAHTLCEAASLRAGKHGDMGGYAHALTVLEDVARRMPPDLGAIVLVHDQLAQYHATLAERLPPGPEWDEHARMSIAELSTAIARMTPYYRALLPGLQASLGLWTGRIRQRPGDLEAGIEMCRAAIRLAGWRRAARAAPESMLSSLLIDLAWEQAGDPPLTQDAARKVHQTLAEAERLIRLSGRRARSDDRAAVLDLRAEVRSARATILNSPGDDPRSARAWRRAVRAAATADPRERVRIGQSWVSWAETTQNAAWCAEAYEYLVSAVPRAVAVRYLAEERDRVLSDVQATAEEAGFWQAMAGRIDKAAIALELGRALSLTETMGRYQPSLEEALVRAGRADLLARYQSAVADYRAATAPAGGASRNGAAQAAWARYDAVIRDIAAVVSVDLPGAQPTLTDLTLAARDGPLVYLASAAVGGYAIIVPSAGPLTCLPLPGLARASVADQVDAFLHSPHLPAVAVATAVRRLWESGIQELCGELPGGSLVTIIPVGLLSLLPVHAAGGPTVPGQRPESWTYLADRVIVRYAHNARALLRARDQAGFFPRSALSLLAVAAPGDDQQNKLGYVGPEVERIGEQWDRGEIVTDGTPAVVSQLLGRHTVWHFACHCDVRPDHILDSALLLTGGQLSLQHILSLAPSARRLAVLSACQTNVSGTELPDEAMGLPAGLIQAGFAGVVASTWSVSDRSAACLMVKFHQLWYGRGMPPAIALAQAQRWLRTASLAELTACLAGDQSQADHEQAPASEASRGTPGRYGHPFHWAAFALTGQ